MNEDILIDLGEVSEETKGVTGGTHENDFILDLRNQ